MSSRCEKELFIEEYFGLVAVITNEETKVITDFGQLVNLLAMFEAQLNSEKESENKDNGCKNCLHENSDNNECLSCEGYSNYITKF